MRHFTFVSDGSNFSRARLVIYRFIVTSYHNSLIFFVMLQAGNFGADAYHSIWHQGFHVTLTICQCAQFFSFSIQLCWRATARRGVVHCLKKRTRRDSMRTVQRSALCRSWRELSNAYFLAKFGFDTAENEPCKVQIYLSRASNYLTNELSN